MPEPMSSAEYQAYLASIDPSFGQEFGPTPTAQQYAASQAELAAFEATPAGQASVAEAIMATGFVPYSTVLTPELSQTLGVSLTPGRPPIASAGFGALIPLLGGLLSKLGVAGKVAGAVGGLGGLAGLFQSLGGGEGGGLFGTNLLGGDVSTIPGSDVILQGPGLPEPYPRTIAKQWTANGAQFYLLVDGRIAVYSKAKRRWKVYRPPKLAIIGKNLPRHQMLVRLRHNLKRHVDDAKTILRSQGYVEISRPKRRHHYSRR